MVWNCGIVPLQWHSTPFQGDEEANLNTVRAVKWKNNSDTCLRSYSLSLNYLPAHLLIGFYFQTALQMLCVCVLCWNTLLSDREFPAQAAIFVFTCDSGSEGHLSLFYDEVIGSTMVESDWHGHGNTKACFSNWTVSFGQNLSLTISQVLQGCVGVMQYKGLN